MDAEYSKDEIDDELDDFCGPQSPADMPGAEIAVTVDKKRYLDEGMKDVVSEKDYVVEISLNRTAAQWLAYYLLHLAYSKKSSEEDGYHFHLEDYQQKIDVLGHDVLFSM